MLNLLVVERYLSCNTFENKLCATNDLYVVKWHEDVRCWKEKEKLLSSIDYWTREFAMLKTYLTQHEQGFKRKDVDIIIRWMNIGLQSKINSQEPMWRICWKHDDILGKGVKNNSLFGVITCVAWMPMWHAWPVW